MYINPQIAIDEGWITHPKCDTTDDWERLKFVSPNAIDFTVDHMSSIHDMDTFVLSEELKRMRGGSRMDTIPVDQIGDCWRLLKHTTYDALSDMYVNLPDGVAAELIIRSTLSRNGIFLTSGLYDSGYEGHIGCALHNRSGEALIAPATRIGQIKFVESSNAKSYAGSYNHSKGSHWATKDVTNTYT